MPSVNITITKNALAPDVLRSVVREILSAFLDCHGADRSREIRSRITSARVIEIEPEHFFIEGDVALRPRYEIEFVTFLDVLNAQAKALLAERTTAILRAVDPCPPRPEEHRIWCFFREVADGDWASDGKIYTSREVVRWMAQRAREQKECAHAMHHDDASVG